MNKTLLPNQTLGNRLGNESDGKNVLRELAAGASFSRLTRDLTIGQYRM